MSPVLTDFDVAILMSQKTPDGNTIYLYPVVRDIDVLLSDEDGPESLEELLREGIKPNFASIREMFQSSSDIEFTFDEETNTVKGTHKNLLTAGSSNGSPTGTVGYGEEIRIPTFSFDMNGHITGIGTSVITLPKGYVLPKATSDTLGGIILGNGLIADENGKVSVPNASESANGVVKLSSSTDSESVTEAATPKAVKLALATAINHINDSIKNIEDNGVKPNFNALKESIIASDDINITFDEGTKTISPTHKNNINAGEIAGTEGSVKAGSTFNVPAFTIDGHGHIVNHRLVSITLPDEYILPTASTTKKGGVIVGDGLEIDSETAKLKVKKGSTTVEGIVKLDNSTNSSAENVAATPKAVSSAKEESINYTNKAIEDVKKELNEEGVTPEYSSSASLFGDSSDILADKDDENKIIKFKHKNTVNPSSVSSGNSTINNGGSFSVPKFSYDEHGHIIESGKETITINPLEGSNGINVEDNKIGHENIITPGSTISNESKTIKFKESFNVPEVTYDKHGHVVSVSYKSISLPDNPDTNTLYGIDITKGNETSTNGEGYDIISETHTVKLSGSDGQGGGSANIISKYFRYKDFAGSVHGLVPAAASTDAGKFLKSDGSWGTPDNTIYNASNGIVLDGTTFKHTNSITEGNVTPGSATTLKFGDVVKIPTISYDAHGHIKSAGVINFTLPSNPNVTYELTQNGNIITLTGSDGSSTDIEIETYTHPVSGVTAGSYRLVTVDANGHVKSGSNPTTLAEYGIIDAANKEHKHDNDDITSLDGSKITGTLPLEVIPKGALERLVPVTNDTARFALTQDDVQIGDTVKVESTGLMYYVKDTSNLKNENGYEPYTAGSASSVPWSGITGKPSTFTPSTHTHKYAASSTEGGAANNAISDGNNQNIASTYIKNISAVGNVVTVTYGNDTTTTFTTQDTDTTYSAFKAATSSAAGGSGLVPAPAAGKQNSFLRGDGTWATPTDTTYSAFKAATSSAAGGSGLVPAPAAGSQNKFLRGDGTWATPTDTTYTLSSFGINVSASEINNLSGLSNNVMTLINGKSSTDHKHSEYVNQNAFGKFVIGNVTVEADAAIDTFTFVPGENITLVGDNSTGKLTITAKDTIYTHPEYTARNSGLYKFTVDSTGHVSGVTAVTKADITDLGIPGSNTTYSAFKAATSSAAGGSGLVPAPAAGKQNSFLRGDGTWATPTDTTYNNFKAATSSAAGGSGLVPAPAAGSQNKFLRGDGTWATPTDTKYTLSSFGINASASEINLLDGVTATTDQLNYLKGVTSDIQTQLNGKSSTDHKHNEYVNQNAFGKFVIGNVTVEADAAIDTFTFVAGENITITGDATNDKLTITAKDTIYTHPEYTARNSGLYKFTVDSTGHVSGVTAVTKADITDLGIPGSNTTYSAFKGATSSVAGGSGLVPAPAAGAQNKFLRGDGTWVIPTNTTYSAFKAATSSAAGGSGLVPAPAAGKQNSFLRGDGTWATPTDTTYSAASSSTLGLVKIGNNITVDSGTISLTKDNVTNALGYTPPTTNTTYSAFKAATSSAAGGSGLVPAPAAGKQNSFLRGDGTWATPTNTDTKNTAGSTDTSSKIFLIGATSQAANPQTYSHDTVYVGTDGYLYSGSKKVSVEGHSHSNASTSAAGFMSTAMVTKLNSLEPVVISDTQPSAPSSGYLMWYKVLSTE